MSTETRSELAKLLLEKIAAIQVQDDEIEVLKTRLREMAKGAGSFIERFPGLGIVDVKAAKSGTFKGTIPELVPEIYLAMTDEEREALTKQGLVKMTHLYGKPFNGSITAKLQPDLI